MAPAFPTGIPSDERNRLLDARVDQEEIHEATRSYSDAGSCKRSLGSNTYDTRCPFDTISQPTISSQFPAEFPDKNVGCQSSNPRTQRPSQAPTDRRIHS